MLNVIGSALASAILAVVLMLILQSQGYPQGWINFLFYTVMIFPCVYAVLMIVLTEQRLLQTSMRRERGECVHCGYRLADGPHSVARCPECGRPRAL
jgi:hypothetical protein